ncbi:MAG: hypothetical protein QHH75_13965 [Bacillota bacterium]|nr:hypothetical protein [Bacillota bacterium]
MSDLSRNQKEVLGMLKKCGHLSGMLELQCLTYIAQEIDWIKTDYLFDFSLNLPFSSQLERDCLILELRGLITGAQEPVPSGLRLTTKGAEAAGGEPDAGFELCSFDPRFLILLSQLLYLRSIREDQEPDLGSLIKKVFFVHDESEVNEGIKFLQKAGVSA